MRPDTAALDARQNLNSPHKFTLGYVANYGISDVTSAHWANSQRLLHRTLTIDEAVEGLKDDFGHFADVAQFLENLSEDSQEWRKELLSRVALARRMLLYAPHLLNNAGDLWQACQDRHGEGSGYRVDVSQQFQAHFDTDADAMATAVKVENQVKALWVQIVVDALVASSAFTEE